MFSVDYDAVAVNDILDIGKYLLKKADIKRCLDLLKRSLLRQRDVLDAMH